MLVESAVWPIGVQRLDARGDRFCHERDGDERAEKLLERPANAPPLVRLDRRRSPSRIFHDCRRFDECRHDHDRRAPQAESAAARRPRLRAPLGSHPIVV